MEGKRRKHSRLGRGVCMEAAGDMDLRLPGPFVDGLLRCGAQDCGQPPWPPTPRPRPYGGAGVIQLVRPCGAALKENREGQVLAKGVGTRVVPCFECYVGQQVTARSSVLNLWHTRNSPVEFPLGQSVSVQTGKNEESIRYVRCGKNYVPSTLCQEALSGGAISK